MVVYEGPIEGLLEKVEELGGKRLRVEVVEEPVGKPFDREAHERNLKALADLTRHTKPLPSLSFTAEDFYLPDRFGPDGMGVDE